MWQTDNRTRLRVRAGVAGSWGRGGGPLALAMSQVHYLEMHDASPFLLPSFSISFFLSLDIWFWTPLRALLDVVVRFKEASLPASLRHICDVSASRRMSGISPWVV